MIRSNTSYSRVAQALRRQILNGAYAPGEQLPTERRLCEQFDTSRITIRRALQILDEELLIERRQGCGTFVSERPRRKIPLLTSDFFGSMNRHAPEMRRRVPICQWRAPSPMVGEALSLPAGERVLYARRTDVLGDKPVAWDEICLTEATASGITEAELATVDFLYRWQKRGGFELDYMQQAIEVTPADAMGAELLGIEVGLPLLKTLEVAFARNGRAVGHFTGFYPSDMYRLTATVKLAAGADRGTGRGVIGGRGNGGRKLQATASAGPMNFSKVSHAKGRST